MEHVTLQLTYGLDAPTTTLYTLKVWGCNEYLVPTTFLSDYEYVHDCIKLDEDIVLILIPDSKKDKSFARTVRKIHIPPFYYMYTTTSLRFLWVIDKSTYIIFKINLLNTKYY